MIILELSTYSNKTIETTTEHPFWVVGFGWKDAQYLKVGDKLLLYNKQYVKVKAFERRILSRKVLVYNFEVEGNHTYFVGDGVWVHNACKGPGNNLTKGGRKKAKNLDDVINLSARDAIKARGGNGSAVNKLANNYADKTVTEIANLAAKGDSNAETALKLIKQAKKKAERYRGK